MINKQALSIGSSGEKAGYRWLQRCLVVGLAAIAVLTVLPGFFSGQWPWSQPLEVPGLEMVRSLKQTGLAVPGWPRRSQETIRINDQTWSLEEYALPNGRVADLPIEAIALLLHPQSDEGDLPALEWLDLSGAQRWQTDARQILTVPAPAGISPDQKGHPFQVALSRQRNGPQTFATVQWYAWWGGGHPSPSRWFWADQLTQWQRGQRLPWVAVSILMPLDPLARLPSYAPAAIALAQSVQAELLQGPLHRTP